MVICVICGAPCIRFDRASQRHTHENVTLTLRDHLPIPVEHPAWMDA